MLASCRMLCAFTLCYRFALSLCDIALRFRVALLLCSFTLPFRFALSLFAPCRPLLHACFLASSALSFCALAFHPIRVSVAYRFCTLAYMHHMHDIHLMHRMYCICDFVFDCILTHIQMQPTAALYPYRFWNHAVMIFLLIYLPPFWTQFPNCWT